VVNYDELDTDVIQKSKGLTNGGDPQIEVARTYTDVGQNVLRDAALTRNDYAFKVIDNDAELGFMNTVYYFRGKVLGPERPGGRVEDFEIENFTIAINQREVVVDSYAIPDWVMSTRIGGVTKYARMDLDFVNKRYWMDGLKDFEDIIRYSCATSILYQKADGTFAGTVANTPVVETGLGFLRFANRARTNIKFSRDLRINWRCTIAALGVGESLTDGQAVTTVEGGSGIYIAAGEPAGVACLGNWTGTAPATGHTLNVTGGSTAITATVTAIWVHSNVTVAKNALGLDAVANGACTVTATGANGSVTQVGIASSSDWVSSLWARRVTGTGAVSLTVDGSTWDARTVTSSTYARFVSDEKTLANPTLGIRLATNGDAVVVDYTDTALFGPIQTDCVPVTSIGKGLARMPAFGGSTGTTTGNPNLEGAQADLYREFPDIIDNVRDFTVYHEVVVFTKSFGGNYLQLDEDGTGDNVAINNNSAEGTASNGNFGITYETPDNPPFGFGNDPQGPKADPNLVHKMAWAAHLYDRGDGFVEVMIAADGSEAEVNDTHPLSHFPLALKNVRFSQWDTTLSHGNTKPGWGYSPGWERRLAFFDGATEKEECEAMVAGWVPA
jgi:hypothetical protein